MKEVYYDNTKSNVNLVSTHNSYADKINKIKYSMDVNKVYANNMIPKKKMNIISEKPTTRVLSSSLNFKPLGFIFIAIIILSALSFFLLFFLKQSKEKIRFSLRIAANNSNNITQIINSKSNQLSILSDYKVIDKIEGEYLRNLDENEFNKTDGKLYNKTKGIIIIDLFFDSPLTNLDHMFEGCEDIIYIDLSHIQPPSIDSMSHTFKGCKNLQKINLTSIDTSKVKSMDSLFENCISLTDILGIERFNTSSLNSISRMFYNCTDLIVANLSEFNIDKIYNINETFFNHKNLKYIDLRNSLNDTKINNILPLSNNNLTVIINKSISKENITNHTIYSIIYPSEFELKCDKNEKGYKCHTCKNNSFECENCNEGYDLYDYLSNMRCWKFETYKNDTKEEIKENEEIFEEEKIEEKGEELEEKNIEEKLEGEEIEEEGEEFEEEEKDEEKEEEKEKEEEEKEENKEEEEEKDEEKEEEKEKEKDEEEEKDEEKEEEKEKEKDEEEEKEEKKEKKE